MNFWVYVALSSTNTALAVFFREQEAHAGAGFHLGLALYFAYRAYRKYKEEV